MLKAIKKTLPASPRGGEPFARITDCLPKVLRQRVFLASCLHNFRIVLPHNAFFQKNLLKCFAVKVKCDIFAAVILKTIFLP